MMKMTTKQVAAEFQAKADRSSHNNGLWKGAYMEIARICRTYHRARAIAMLDRIAKRLASMSVSSAYGGAANQLREEE